MLLIFPSIASRNEFTGERNSDYEIDEELEDAEDADFLHGGRVWLFRPDFFAFRNLLVAFLLPLQPSLVLSLLCFAIFGVSVRTRAIMSLSLFSKACGLR